MQHVFSSISYKCTMCGASIHDYQTGVASSDCPGKPIDPTETPETDQERIWKAIRGAGR